MDAVAFVGALSGLVAAIGAAIAVVIKSRPVAPRTARSTDPIPGSPLGATTPDPTTPLDGTGDPGAS
jgi:hypothetical protein